jgi:PAS domain S-box-containing protein
VAPLLLVWLGARPRLPSSPERAVEAMALLGAITTVTLAAFSRDLGLGVSYPLHYTIFPLVVYAALRFEQHGATAASFTASAIAIWGTVHGQGPLAVGASTERVVMLLLFLAVVAVTGLLLAAAIGERNAAERRRAAGFERLEESEQRLRLALEAGRMGVWDWDLTSGDIRWSHHLEESLGLPPGGFPGTLDAFRSFVHPDDLARVDAVIAAALEQGDYEDEVRVVRRDGAVRWMAASGIVLRDATGRAVRMLGVGVDVTERRRLEEEITRRADALSEADRRKDVFLAMLAHELRTPLAPLANVLHLMRVAPAERDRALAIADRQVGQLARLVDDLLDVSRITQGKIELSRERVAIADVVGRAVETARPQIEAGGQVFTTELPAEPVWLDGDPLRLAQVIANLLGNAAKYTPRGGSIRLSAARDGAAVVIRVRDTGAGIPAGLLPRIFDLFVQGDASLERRQGGLGVGLTIVQQLVALHGGRVEAHPAPDGRGSEFVVSLPVAAAAGAPEPPPRVLAGANGARRCVLLVEDNEDAAESLARVLELWGHQVRVASDGPGALTELAGAEADVILSDLGLPGMDGYELARRIRAMPRGRGAVLIALSGYGQDEDHRRALAAGFDHHMVKPPDLGALAALLAQTPPSR